MANFIMGFRDVLNGKIMLFQNFMNFVVKAVINEVGLKKDKILGLGGLAFVFYDFLKINIFEAVGPETVF